jgi:hypothetical protein
MDGQRFIQKTVTVNGASVVLYSLDGGEHWDSNKKLLLQWQRQRVKKLDDFKTSWKRGTPKKVPET